MTVVAAVLTTLAPTSFLLRQFMKGGFPSSLSTLVAFALIIAVLWDSIRREQARRRLDAGSLLAFLVYVDGFTAGASDFLVSILGSETNSAARIALLALYQVGLVLMLRMWESLASASCLEDAARQPLLLLAELSTATFTYVAFLAVNPMRPEFFIVLAVKLLTLVFVNSNLHWDVLHYLTRSRSRRRFVGTREAWVMTRRAFRKLFAEQLAVIAVVVVIASEEVLVRTSAISNRVLTARGQTQPDSQWNMLVAYALILLVTIIAIPVLRSISWRRLARSRILRSIRVVRAALLFRKAGASYRLRHGAVADAAAAATTTAIEAEPLLDRPPLHHSPSLIEEHRAKVPTLSEHWLTHRPEFFLVIAFALVSSSIDAFMTRARAPVPAV